MDRERADFDMAYNGLSSILGMKPVTLYMPIVNDGVFTGLVDILGGKASCSAKTALFPKR